MSTVVFEEMIYFPPVDRTAYVGSRKRTIGAKASFQKRYGYYAALLAEPGGQGSAIDSAAARLSLGRWRGLDRSRRSLPDKGKRIPPSPLLRMSEPRPTLVITAMSAHPYPAILALNSSVLTHTEKAIYPKMTAPLT